MRETVKLMKVLADESRLRVLNLIQERECCVCEVMLVMGISQSKASRICSALYETGLLELRREGRWALYSIKKESAQGYVGDILAGIKKSLADNPAAQADLARLREVEKMVPDCASDECVEKIPESMLRLKSTRQTA